MRSRTTTSMAASRLGRCRECGVSIEPGHLIARLTTGGWICADCAAIPTPERCGGCVHPMDVHTPYGCGGAVHDTDDARRVSACHCRTAGQARGRALCRGCLHELPNHDNGGCRDCSCLITHAGVAHRPLVQLLPEVTP